MSLNRKAMALAVGAALAPCAYAQVTSPAGTNWEFYGKFYPEMTHAHGEGASTGATSSSTIGAKPASGGNAVIPRWEMQISNTYIGFRGDRQVEGGMATGADGQHRRGEHHYQLRQPQLVCRIRRCRMGNDQAGQYGYALQE